MIALRLQGLVADHIGRKGPNNVFIARCYREFYHAQWAIIVADESLEAYVHGVVIDCCNGRCLFTKGHSTRYTGIRGKALSQEAGVSDLAGDRRILLTSSS
jgi:hypothetical protein